jgi:very-short-patch-repair endonuclease
VERQNLKPKTHRARDLRQQSTDSEGRLWSILRNRQLGGCKFRRQFPIDRYFADFACREAKLIVEIDGSQHADHAAYDAERTRIIETYGWHVMRVTNHDVLANLEGVADAILNEIQSARR